MAKELVAAKVNDFGLSLLSTLLGTAGNTSVVVSPISIVSALGMVSLGTTPDQDAQRELLGMWGVDSQDADAFFEGLHQVTSGLRSAGEGTTFVNVNSLWCRRSIRPSFVQAAKQEFDAEARPLPASAGPINSWCSQATHGLIPEIISGIDPKTVAVLLNAVYFKGSWAAKFRKDRSEPGLFASTGGQRRCTMMRRTDKHMRYLEQDGVQAVELPYGSAQGRFAAVVLLPPRGDGELAKLADRLGSQPALLEQFARFGPAHVNLQLPRFRVEFGAHELMPELKSRFGIRGAEYGSGQFLRMSDDPDVHLDSVQHKVVVKVNEEGSEAAAATAAVMMTREAILVPSPPIDVIVDRPFMFLIRDTATGMLLFAGALEDPDFDV